MVSDGPWRGARLLQVFHESLEKFSDPVHADLFKTAGQKKKEAFSSWYAKDWDVENRLRNLRGLVEVGKAEDVVSRIFREEPFSEPLQEKVEVIENFPFEVQVSLLGGESFDVRHDPLQ